MPTILLKYIVEGTGLQGENPLECHMTLAIVYTLKCCLSLFSEKLQIPIISVFGLHEGCEFEYHSGEVYSIQHYVVKFVSDLRHVCVFLGGTPVSSTKKKWNIAEVMLNTITLTLDFGLT